MSRPAFLCDHDVNEHIVDGMLRREPTTVVVRAREVGLDHVDDNRLLAYAAERGYIVISHDVNTMAAAAYDRLDRQLPMAGLLLARQTAPVARIIDCLEMIWGASEAAEWQGVVAFLPL
jgi:predicted nuclease of predicted toxin-antitoxin system